MTADSSQLHSNRVAFVKATSRSMAPPSLAVATGAAVVSIEVVDRQIAAINYARIQGGFEGAAQMMQAVQNIQAVAARWSAVKAAVLGAAQGAVAAGPAAAALGAADTTAPQMAGNTKSFASNTLAKVVSAFTSAKGQFDTFSAAMDQAYSVGANANQTAAAAVTREQQQVQGQIATMQARERDLRSSGSIVCGIFTLGGTIIAQIVQLQQEERQLRDAEQQEQYEFRSYQASLASFSNALNATKLASYALSTLNTTLQQSVNALSDIAASSSGNFAVMQAELQQFKTEYASAVTTVQGLLAS